MNIPGDIIEKIIRTEIILERQIGKNVPFALYIEALNAVGIKTKMIKLDEIPNAIREAKRSVNSGKLKVSRSSQTTNFSYHICR